MSIIIYLGNPGSGKSACAVRDLVLNPGKYKSYTNIIPKRPKDTPNIVPIEPEMIIRKDLVGVKKKRSGEQEPVYEYSLNQEFWKNIKEPINVILDEAHTLLNSRRAMSRVNIIMGDFQAMVRRVLGQRASGYGDLIYITQLWNKIDIDARNMATQVRYHLCRYRKICNKCKVAWKETSQMPEPAKICPVCHSNDLDRQDFVIEVWHFASMRDFISWKEYGVKTEYRHYYVTDIEEYFPYYDTLQWDNMLSKFY